MSTCGRGRRVVRCVLSAALSLPVALSSGTSVGGGCTIEGTGKGEILRGTRGSDVICGKGGGDRILGFRGDDVVFGGPGSDDIEGGFGDDRLFGGGGHDSVEGGEAPIGSSASAGATWRSSAAGATTC